MPIRKPQRVTGFRYIGTSPVIVIGIGELGEGDFVPIDRAKEVFGEDFRGSTVLVPVQDEDEKENNGGES